MSEKKHINLWRIRETGVSTLGTLDLVEPGAESNDLIPCLEPTGLFNLPYISCIPEGEYPLRHHVSPTFGKCLIVEDVKDRENVLFHAGNFFTNTEACILPGMRFAYVNKDAQVDVQDSKAALDVIIDWVPAEGCQLIVREIHGFQSVFGGGR